MKQWLFITIWMGFAPFLLLAQSEGTAVITGVVTDAETGTPVDLATIYIKGTSTATESSTNGRYRIEIPANQFVILVFTRIGYKETEVPVEALPPRAGQQIDVACPQQNQISK